MKYLLRKDGFPLLPIGGSNLDEAILKVEKLTDPKLTLRKIIEDNTMAVFDSPSGSVYLLGSTI